MGFSASAKNAALESVPHEARLQRADSRQAAEQRPAPGGEPCAPGQDDRTSELCAQWKAADAAQLAADVAFWIGIIGAIIGALTLSAAVAAAKFARDAARHTDAANRTAQEGLRQATEHHLAQNRAWLVIEDLRVERVHADTFENGRIWVEASFSAKNVGHSAAVDVGFFKFTSFGFGSNQTSFLDSVASSVGDHAVAPQQSVWAPYHARVSCIPIPVDATGAADLTISISLNYRSAGDDTIHQTSTTFMIGSWQGGFRIFGIKELLEGEARPADVQLMGRDRLT